MLREQARRQARCHVLLTVAKRPLVDQNALTGTRWRLRPTSSGKLQSDPGVRVGKGEPMGGYWVAKSYVKAT